MTPKIDWKQRYSATVKDLDKQARRSETLRIERDNALRDRDEAIVRADMPRLCKCSPNIKIVEKEVLPTWHWLYVLLIVAVCAIHFLWCMNQVIDLQQPILSPYPIRITRYIYDDENLKICKDAWREDQAIIRKLKRRIAQ